MKSLEHNFEHKSLFFGQNLDLLYKPPLASWMSDKCEYNSACSHPTYFLGAMILSRNCGTY